MGKHVASSSPHPTVGVGIKPEHHHDIWELDTYPPLFEIISENYMWTQGFPWAVVEKVSQNTAISLHGVSLSVGSSQIERHDYLDRLQSLAARLNPCRISVHLRWTGWGHATVHDLLPLPLTDESLQVVIHMVHKTQEILGRTIALENISQYVDFHENQMDETEFFRELTQATGCGILLDVNNIVVNSVNFGFTPQDHLDRFPHHAVTQYHVAGHTQVDDYLYDTHRGPVPDNVLKLLKYAVTTHGFHPIILEWDTDVPSFHKLMEERQRIEDYLCET